jgi:DNA polymerase theta
MVVSRVSDNIKNTELLAEWINASYFVSTYRPVPIDDYLVFDNAIYPAATSRQLFQTITKLASAQTASLTDTMPPHRIVEPSKFREFANPTANAMVALAVDTAAAGYGALVFCGSRQGCQIHASTISEAMPAQSAVDPEELGKRLDLLAELRSLPSGLDPVLETTLVKGVGFHREYLAMINP